MAEETIFENTEWLAPTEKPSVSGYRQRRSESVELDRLSVSSAPRSRRLSEYVTVINVLGIYHPMLLYFQIGTVRS